jgi:hypothetical protein
MVIKLRGAGSMSAESPKLHKNVIPGVQKCSVVWRDSAYARSWKSTTMPDEYSIDRRRFAAERFARARQTTDLNVRAQLPSIAQGSLDLANEEFNHAEPNVWNKTFYHRIIQAKSG